MTAAASSPADRAAEACSCFWTDPSTWTTHYGAVEPGSQREWNPECPEHGQATLIRSRLDNADTQGPWEIEPDEHGTRLGSKTCWVGICPDCGTTAEFDSGDADLIANAPQDLAWLLSEHDRLNALVGELTAQLNAAASAIREKHRPLSNGGFSSRKNFVCDGHETWLAWPCSEAKRVYTEDEIQQVLGGVSDVR